MDTKEWWKSTGIWGSLVTMGSLVVFLAFGVEITAEQQTTIINNAVAIGTAASSLVGLILAIRGRVKAKAKIGK